LLALMASNHTMVTDSQGHNFLENKMATDDQIKARQDLIKHLSSLTEQEAAAEINIEAAFLAGNNEQAIQAEADKLKQ